MHDVNALDRRRAAVALNPQRPEQTIMFIANWNRAHPEVDGVSSHADLTNSALAPPHNSLEILQMRFSVVSEQEPDTIMSMISNVVA